MTRRSDLPSGSSTHFNRLSYVERGMSPLLVVRLPVRWVHTMVKVTKGWFKKVHHGAGRKRSKVLPAPDITSRPNGTIIAGRLAEDDDKPASIDSSQGVFHCPLLPPEIWGEILWHATNTYPHPISIHDFSKSSSIEAPRIACLELCRRLHRLSLTIKLSISAVCHTWRELGIPFLYSSIRLTSSHGVAKLLSIFDDDTASGKKGPQLRAWWVRELWMDTNICNCLMPASVNSLSGLLKHVPRLVTIRKFGKLDWSINDAEDGTNLLEQVICRPGDITTEDEKSPFSTGSGPKYVEWAFTHMWGFQHFLSANPSLNGTLPSILTLELRPSFVYFFDVPDSPADIISHVPHFPSLTTLRLLGSPSCFQAMHFKLPALRSLTILSTAFDRLHEDDALVGLLRTHGERLEELELDITFYRPLPELNDLSDMCPNLRRLQVPASTFLYKRLPHLQHPTITTIGIQGMHTLVHNKSHAKFTKRLMSFLENFPAAEVVQDLSLKSHELRQRSVGLWTAQDALDHRSFWVSLVESLEQAGIMLVDWSGRSVAGFERAKYMTVMTSEADEVARGLICCH